ncbi:MAG: TetR/AcrR family transcriptional regulator [Acidimicrobiales bacterium]
MAATRTRTPSAAMEATLLGAASDLLESEGPEALSIRRIAATAGVAPMGVYNHFASKAGIVESLFIQGFERLGEAMVTLGDIDDPYDALLEGGRRYRALARAHPMAYRVMFLQAVPGFEPSQAALTAAAAAFDGLVASVGRAMRAGVLSDGDPALVAQMIWASVHGWMTVELAGMGFVDDSEAGGGSLCAALLAGLAPRS